MIPLTNKRRELVPEQMIALFLMDTFSQLYY